MDSLPIYRLFPNYFSSISPLNNFLGGLSLLGRPFLAYANISMRDKKGKRYEKVKHDFISHSTVYNVACSLWCKYSEYYCASNHRPDCNECSFDLNSPDHRNNRF